MSLKISKNSGLTDLISIGGAQTNPLTTSHPIAGSTVETKVWLFNDDATKRYESITIDPTDATGTDESTWLFLAPDNAGVAGTYLSAGVALAMANISNSSVGYPFWVKVVAPTVSNSQNKTDIKLTTNFSEFAV